MSWLPAGVQLTPLKRVQHPKGDILHALKVSEASFETFGEAYFTTINRGDTKGWKKHTRMQMNLIVPVGGARFFVYDESENRGVAIDLGDRNYARLTVPPGLWVAFTSTNEGLNLILNLASLEHDPDEAINVPLESFRIPE